MGNSSPDKARALAWLFVHGPAELRGEWEASSKAAGYVRPPRRDSKQINELIRQFESEANMVADVLAQADALSWEELAERVRPVLAAVAAGKAYANTQQMAALKEIVQRGEGKVGTKQQDAQDVGVVVLPMLGEGMDAHLCPSCIARLEQESIDAARRMEA